MKLHSLFLITAFLVTGCQPKTSTDAVVSDGADTLIIEKPVSPDVSPSPVKAPVKVKPIVKDTEKLVSPDGSVVELSSEEDVEVVSPIFFDCEHKRKDRARDRCSEKLLQDFVLSTLEFEGAEGEEHYASVKFTIKTNGATSNVTILGSSSDAFAAAVKKALLKLNEEGYIWTPAVQGDLPVHFDYFTEFELKY